MIGDTVSEEDPIADAMTDKATIELTSPVDGVIKSMACEEGDMLAVGAVLVKLEIEGEGEAPEPEAPEIDVEPEPVPAAKKTAPSNPVSKTPVARSVTNGKVLASPAIRARAARLSIDLAIVPSEGARVSHADLDAYLIAGANISTSPASRTPVKPSPAFPHLQETSSLDSNDSISDDPIPGETRQKVIGLRRVIAARMTCLLYTSPSPRDRG